MGEKLPECRIRSVHSAFSPFRFSILVHWNPRNLRNLWEILFGFLLPSCPVDELIYLRASRTCSEASLSPFSLWTLSIYWTLDLFQGPILRIRLLDPIYDFSPFELPLQIACD